MGRGRMKIETRHTVPQFLPPNFLALEVAALQLLRVIALGLTPGLPGNLASAIVNEVMGMATA